MFMNKMVVAAVENMLQQIEIAATAARNAAAEVAAAAMLAEMAAQNAAVAFAARRAAKQAECTYSARLSRSEHAAAIWACRPVVRALRAAAKASPMMYVGEVVHNSPKEFAVMNRLASNGQSGAGLYFAIAPMASAAPSQKWGQYVYGAVVGRQVKDMRKTFHTAVRSVVGDDTTAVFKQLSYYKLLDFLGDVVVDHIEFGAIYVRYADSMAVTKLI